MHRLNAFMRGLFFSAALLCIPAEQVLAADSQNPPERINHVIVIYQENWSFDGLYGKFPGANGLAAAGAAVTQVDKEEKPLQKLPRPLDTSQKPATPDIRFPEQLAAEPYDLSQYVSPDQKTGDLVHRYYQNQLQIDGGKMDKFAVFSDNPGLVMSYYDASDLPEGKLARQYTLADNFFQAAFGGSLLNHFWLICACTPLWPEAPESMIIKLDSRGIPTQDNAVTPDGFVVNTAYSVNQPHPINMQDRSKLMPLQTMPTIGDRLSERNITWAWYAGGWNNALAGNPDNDFQYHHQPFIYFANYADGTPAKAAHLKDEQDFLKDLQNGNLPSVSFIKPIGTDNEHPGYASLL
ncbi:MAG TPA: alkaline phosphatase family protein, partial [Syntrophales bacterium]|nr:alkaline phosphatase family protein [Syntrophales bacterium]